MDERTLEIFLASLSLVLGLSFTVRSLARIMRQTRAVNTLGLPATSPEWVLVREKLILIAMVGLAQALGVVVIVLALVFDAPRPPHISSMIQWSLVAIFLILGLISVHSERSYHREKEALDLALNGQAEEIGHREEHDG